MKIMYWAGTVILSLIMAFSVTMYFTNTSAVQEVFQQLGYPPYLVIPLAIAKVLGLAAIISNLNSTLKEWAYFGFLLDILLAIVAHLVARDGQALFAFVALIGWAGSYVGYRRSHT